MQSKNIFLIIAGVINLFTALLHLIGGQVDLVNPLIDSNLNVPETAQFLGVWHMVTVLLFYSSIVLLLKGFRPQTTGKELISFVGIAYVLFGVCFVGISLYESMLVPQFILLAPIGILALLGKRKMSKS